MSVTTTPTIRVENAPEGWQGALHVLVRRNDDESDYQSCHLFLYTGTLEWGEALDRAAREYCEDPTNAAAIAEWEAEENREFDWFQMMAEWGDYAEAFAKHGITEIMIPMGMDTLMVAQDDAIGE